MKKKRFIQSNDKNLSFSICIPVYKGSSLLRECLQSIVKQGFTNYEIIIGEDTPPEYRDEIKKTQEIIQSFPNQNIQYFKNKMNLGYPKNLQKIVSFAKNDIIFLMGQDDILSRNALQKTHDAFFLGNKRFALSNCDVWNHLQQVLHQHRLVPQGNKVRRRVDALGVCRTQVRQTPVSKKTSSRFRW
mgnify:CR=1 FL=1